MRGRALHILLAILLSTVLLVPGAAMAGTGDMEREYLLDFGGALPGDAEALVLRAGGTLKETLPDIGVVVASSRDRQFSNRAQGNAEVQSVVADRLVNWLGPNDRIQAIDATTASSQQAADFYYLADGWNIKRVGGTPKGAWAIEKGNHSAKVAVMDTGVYAAHPDIAPNYLFGRSFVPGEDENDYNGHGTFVAGIIAGALGGGAVVGVGPGLGLVNYKVLDAQGNGKWSWLLRAIYQSAADGVTVANLSLGGPVDLTTRDGQKLWRLFQRAADHATKRGVLLVAAGMNNAIDFQDPAQSRYRYIPVQLDGVIGVSATTKQDKLAFYSSYGRGVIDLAGPGGDLGPGYPASSDRSYLITSSASPKAPAGSLYGHGAGTSFAAPHVAAAAGLLAVEVDGLRLKQIAARLEASADDLGPRGYDGFFGYGLVDATKALKRVDN
ncbi:MAG: hypothetical protein EPO21_23820 [Chloroflexota bacterium]|nr:MAG: hypothetical protein EPO21_23820 [Chloroflexota bacterium]